MTKKKQLDTEQTIVLLEILKKRFEANMHRHHGLNWVDIEDQLKQKSEKLWSLKQMKETGEEPDIVSFGSKSSETIFYDCAVETPKGRRSLCYDRAALDARKNISPKIMRLKLQRQLELNCLLKSNTSNCSRLNILI